MTGELEMCAAAFFRTVGKDVATVDEFVMEVSLGRKWMAPSDAKALLAKLVKAGILEQRDGYVRPKVDVGSIDVPLAYRPPKDILSTTAPIEMCQSPKKENAATDMFPKLMEVAVGAGLQRREFIQECNRIQKRLDIDIGVAALIALRDAGVDITPYFNPVYDWVRSSGLTPS